MVIRKVDHFKGSARRWIMAIVLIRGAGVASPPLHGRGDQSCRIVNERWSGRSDDEWAFEVEWFLRARYARSGLGRFRLGGRCEGCPPPG